MATTYLNNALADSMLPDGVGLRPPRTVAASEGAEILRKGFVHAGNPAHWPTWHAAAGMLGMPEIAAAGGERLTLAAGDTLVVASLRGTPRETREFTPEEIAKAKILFRIFVAYSE